MVEDDDGVDEVLHVLHLVGGDDDGTLVGGMLGDDLTEERLRGDVEAVGRLVEEQVIGVEGQGGRDEAFLLLAKRHLGVFARGIHFHFLAEFKEEAFVEVGVEHAKLAHIINRCALRDGEVL